MNVIDSSEDESDKKTPQVYLRKEKACMGTERGTIYSAQSAVGGSEAMEGFLYTAASQTKEANQSLVLLPNGGLRDRLSTAERKERKDVGIIFSIIST